MLFCLGFFFGGGVGIFYFIVIIHPHNLKTVFIFLQVIATPISVGTFRTGFLLKTQT